MSPDDPRQAVLNLLRGYTETWPEEQAMVDRYVAFVADHADCFERTQLSGHVTGSALVLDTSMQRVLLTHHRKLDRWLQPGGHADGETDVASVAMKEAEEESGLPALEFVTADLLDVDIHPIPERKGEPAHFHYDCRFLIRAVGSNEFTVSDESHDLAWVDMNNILDYTDEDSILRMIRKAQALI